jgi:uncharacterized protein YqfB (UPF0267 family)
MVIGFNKQFVPKILKGIKTTTIRVDASQRLQVGKTLHFYTGVRTKNMAQFYEATIKTRSYISITYALIYDPLNSYYCDNRHINHFAVVRVDNKILTRSAIKRLSQSEGFENEESMFNWFNDEFHGVLISW